MGLRIRHAHGDDVQSLWPLCVGFGLFLGEDHSPNLIEAADVARLSEILEDQSHVVQVAESDDELVGYALAQDYGVSMRRDWSIARMHDLYVRPDARRQGIAMALHESVVTWCSKRPVRFLEWQASTTAIDFYTQLGYQPDTRGDFLTNPLFEHEFPEHRANIRH